MSKKQIKAGEWVGDLFPESRYSELYPERAYMFDPDDWRQAGYESREAFLGWIIEFEDEMLREEEEQMEAELLRWDADCIETRRIMAVWEFDIEQMTEEYGCFFAVDMFPLCLQILNFFCKSDNKVFKQDGLILWRGRNYKIYEIALTGSYNDDIIDMFDIAFQSLVGYSRFVIKEVNMWLSPWFLYEDDQIFEYTQDDSLIFEKDFSWMDSEEIYGTDLTVNYRRWYDPYIEELIAESYKDLNS